MRDTILNWIARMAMKPLDLLHDRYCPCQFAGYYEDMIEKAAERQAESEAHAAADPDPREPFAFRVERRAPWDKT